MLDIVHRSGKTLGELVADLKNYPQVILNVRVREKKPLDGIPAVVEAIREATVQVLLALGPQRLTTAHVARRAGVSVGTLYQYFPNKSALLHHALKHHLDQTTASVEQACRAYSGQSLTTIVNAVINAFLDAKLLNLELGTAFYAIAADVDANRIAHANSVRLNATLAATLASSPQPLGKDPALMASLLQAAMAGVARRILEYPGTAQDIAALRHELTASMCAYVQSCTQTPSTS